MLKRIMICAMLVSVNLFAGNAISLSKACNAIYGGFTQFFSAQKQYEHPLLSEDNKNLRNALNAITFLQKVKGIEAVDRRLQQSDILGNNINYEPRLYKPLNKKSLLKRNRR